MFLFIIFLQKCNRRLKTLEKLNLPNDEKSNYQKVLLPEMMSSEEEKFDENGDRYFSVKPLPWRQRKYQKLVSKIDTAFREGMSTKSKEQYVKWLPGSQSKRSPVKCLDFNYDEFVKK